MAHTLSSCPMSDKPLATDGHSGAGSGSAASDRGSASDEMAAQIERIVNDRLSKQMRSGDADAGTKVGSNSGSASTISAAAAAEIIAKKQSRGRGAKQLTDEQKTARANAKLERDRERDDLHELLTAYRAERERTKAEKHADGGAKPDAAGDESDAGESGQAGAVAGASGGAGSATGDDAKAHHASQAVEDGNVPSRHRRVSGLAGIDEIVNGSRKRARTIALDDGFMDEVHRRMEGKRARSIEGGMTALRQLRAAYFQ